MWCARVLTGGVLISGTAADGDTADEAEELALEPHGELGHGRSKLSVPSSE